MCLSVWLSAASKEITAKIFASAFPVAIFVICGFEHCVANMFYLPIAMMISGNFDMLALVHNLIPVTLGNIVGGMILITMYYYAYKD